MVWWGVVIVSLISAGAGAVIVWFMFNRPLADLRTERELARNRQRTAEQVATAERLAHKAIAAEREELAKRLREINAWYRGQKGRIAKNAQRTFEELAGDPDQLDRELDSLLKPDR